MDWPTQPSMPCRCDDQKRVLIDCLDANHLYVNYGDMADEAYGIANEDMRVNRTFYGDKV